MGTVGMTSGSSSSTDGKVSVEEVVVSPIVVVSDGDEAEEEQEVVLSDSVQDVIPLLICDTNPTGRGNEGEASGVGTSSQQSVSTATTTTTTTDFRCHTVGCNASFADLNAYFAHFLQTHKRFKCEKCGQSLVTNEVLSDHLQLFHTSRERVFVCPLCDLKCYSKSGLTNYAKISHPNSADAVVFLASGATTPLNTTGGRSEPFGPVNSATAIGLPFACD
jgi:hypothetical protein